MLIIALVLAVIGLAALVTAVVTSNELIAWVCIGASVIGVILLIVDALRERSRGTRPSGSDEAAATADDSDITEAISIPNDDASEEPVDYPEDAAEASEDTAEAEAETRVGEDTASENVDAETHADAQTETDATVGDAGEERKN